MNATITSPSALVLDGAGNLYFTDNGNNVVRMVDAVTHIITTVAGNGVIIDTPWSAGNAPATASFHGNGTFGVAVDSAANFYTTTGSSSSTVLKATAATGIISTFAGMTNSSGYSGDNGPATSAQLYWPITVAVDGSGNLYITDVGNCNIRKVSASNGIITTVAGWSSEIPVGENYNGDCGYSGDSVPASGSLLSPASATVDTAGNIYIADSGNARIRKVTAATGIITTVAGNGTQGYSGDSGLATSAKLYYPQSVTVDAAGNLYIADTDNNRIRMVTSATGVITTIAGTGTCGYSGDGILAARAELCSPASVVVDAHGDLYVADQCYPFLFVSQVRPHRRAQTELGMVGDRNERGTAAHRLRDGTEGDVDGVSQ